VGTVAVIDVSLTVLNMADVPLNFTDVVPVKFLPVMVTVTGAAEISEPPEAGVKVVIVGAGITVNDDELVAIPMGVVTVILPEVAPDGTTTEIEDALFTV